MTQTEAFLEEIDRFLAQSEMSATAFGRAAVNDPNFVGDLRNKGRKPNLGLVDRVHAFIRQQTGERAA
jgi:hypothetical protein